MRALLSTRGNPALRLADRFAGPPLLWLLGATPRRRQPAAFQRIGVLRTAAIGDTLLLTGPLRDLRDTHPNADIVLITGDHNAGAGAMVAGSLARHLVIPPASPVKATAIIRRERLDLLIDTGAWPRLDALVTALSAARFRIGFRTAGQHRHFAYDLAVDHSPQRHEIDNFRALFAAVGVAARNQPVLSRENLPPVETPGQPFIVFHPWSSGYRGHIKEWPVERWVHLAQRLGTRVPLVVVTGSSSQENQSRALAEAISATGVRATVSAGLPFAQLASLLCHSVAVVTVNTGVMHLSAQLSVPTISLEGPTPPARWGPVGPRVATVVSSYPGCGYLNLGFEYHGERTDCMEGITVQAVEAAVVGLLNHS